MRARWLRIFSPILICFVAIEPASAQAGSASSTQNPSSGITTQLVKERNEWFYRGRLIHGKTSAELRRRAHEAKLKLRALHPEAVTSGQASLSSGSWIPLGPVPLASDASGNGTQDYHQVAGRATAVAIDPADPSGNTLYIGGAQSGIWKSTNAAAATASSVTWLPVSDTQATLSIGAIAIQPGNSDPAKSVILAATGEANNSADSYFGLGMLRSADAGKTWALIGTANGGSLSFAGLGGTRMAFSQLQPNSVVSAMATSSEGLLDGAITGATMRGLYTSLDAGQTWSYNALSDPAGATDATSATSVAYNLGAGKFFAAIRYHGFYSSSDGINWSRLANQPSGSILGAAACPPQSTSNSYGCPIYRGEIAVVPGRNEMYAWYVYFSATGAVVDGGIWESTNGGASWSSISDAGITNCGDVEGCGVQRGSYNLELLAVPNGSGTDLYAGAANIYKCSMNTQNLACLSNPFLNLTHAYGCDPIAPSHVHPEQHALASMIPTTGSDSGNALLYFANDGGIYRALDGYSGLTNGSCSATNAFDNLNQNLGSMTQFVSFSQHPTDANTMMGGAQGNGTPASSQATTNPSWSNVLGGDGGYSAIDPTTPSNWYAANPDVPPGGLDIQLCTSGINCTNSGYDFVVTSGTVGGDDGGFYSPYILDPHSSTAMIVGTCRVWRGPRSGGIFTALSPNFDTLGSGTCSGSEVNQVRSLATAGPTDNSGSSVIYATTGGLGPVEGLLDTPAGGRVWVSTDASAGSSAFVDVTNNGPLGNINPNQFPISSVATDSSDVTGNTAYITVMGFTGGTGHVWKTMNAGATWVDFTANLPDSPANAVVVYPALSQVYVATDVGVFGSSTASPNWTELGPTPSSNLPGYLPNVAVTALGVFASGGQQLLRASTYGRGIWQFNLVVTPDYQLTIANSPLTVFTGQTAVFSGTASALNGYSNNVALTCTAGSTAPPSTCTISPSSLLPASKTPFTVTVGGAAGDYNFNIQGAGSDPNRIKHTVAVTLHLLSYSITTPSPANVTVGRGNTSAPVSFQVTAAGPFAQAVTVSCTTTIAGASCNLTPGTMVNPTAGAPIAMTASVAVPAGTLAGSYPVTIQASTAGAASLTTSFTLNVTANPDFVLTGPTLFPEVNVGSTGTTGSISITSLDSFSGSVALTCAKTYGSGSCSISPTSVKSFPATATLTINGTSFAAGAYSLSVTGTSGALTHTISVPFSVGDFSISGPQTLTAVPGAQVGASLKLASSFSYSGNVNATCDATSLLGAICGLSPPNPVSISSGGTTNLTASISVPNNTAPGTYAILINVQDSTGTPEHSTIIALTVGQDFEVTSSTKSQTVVAGSVSGPYALSVRPVGTSYTGTVSLACSAGLPANAQCIFSPATPVTPGTSSVDVVMNISTQAKKADLGGRDRRWTIFATVGMFLPGLMVLIASSGRRRRNKHRLPLAILFLMPLALMMLSCGGGTATASGGGGTSPGSPIIYQVTVTGTSAGSSAAADHSVIVTLVVD